MSHHSGKSVKSSDLEKFNRDECEVQWDEWKHMDEEPITYTKREQNCLDLYHEYA